MSKPLKNLVFIVLFLVPCLGFGMEPEPPIESLVKIQTSDKAEFNIERQVAGTSNHLKNKVEDIGEEAAVIPLENISGQQFDLLLSAMKQLAQLPQAREKELAEQLQQMVANLKSNEQPLNNQQLIEFIAGANFLDVPLVEPALQVLAQGILNKNEWIRLGFLGPILRDLWQVHPAKNLALEGLSLQHPWVSGVTENKDVKILISRSDYEKTIKVWDINTFKELATLKHPNVFNKIESANDKNLISWSSNDGIIKVRDKNNLQADPTTLHHPMVEGGIESADGKYLISWSYQGTIKVWDINDFRTQPTTLQHSGVHRVIESADGKNLISWSCDLNFWPYQGTIKVWDINNLQAQPAILKHPGVSRVIESADGNHLISWSFCDGIIKVWDKNNLQADPTTLHHPMVEGVKESADGKYLISWSYHEGTMKVWDKRLFDPTPEQIHLLLAVYFENEGNQKFDLPQEKISALKATFPTLVPLFDNKSFAHDALRFFYGHKCNL